MKRLLVILGPCAIVAAEPSAAAIDIRNAGRNVGDTLKTWAVAAFGGVTAIMAVYYLFSRKLAAALGFFALALVVGGFVFAPQEMANLSKSLYQTVLGS
jgi:hypothetical protein